MELREVFEPIVNFLKSLQKKEKEAASKDKAKERLQLVLMQDRASVSPDFFEMMKKEIIEVIKKYIEIDEEALEVQLTRGFEDGDDSGPALYANIPIKNIKPVAKKVEELEDDLVTETVSHEKIIEEAIENVTQKIEASQGSESKQEIKEKKLERNEKKAEEVLETVTNAETSKPTMEATTIEKEKTANVAGQPDADVIMEAAEEVTAEINNASKKKSITEIKEVQPIEKIAEDKKNENQEAMKDKLSEVKDGMTETIQKVKKGAKESIKKIKTKAQKKKIKE